MSIERVSGLSCEDFVLRHLAENHPVIVTDAMSDWPALHKWSPQHFVERFGDRKVQIYGDAFFLSAIRPLRVYVERHILSAQNRKPGKSTPYVRWYSRQDSRDTMPWSDEVFAALAGDWSRPYFMPVSDLLLPFSRSNALDPVVDSFPARAVFLSARGSRTRLHMDPWASDALLCQVYGEKRFCLFHPDDSAALLQNGEPIDIQYDPESDSWGDAPVAPWADDCLRPGEIVLIPAGWHHAFESTTPSISLTWNFVHRVRLPEFTDYLMHADIRQGEQDSLAYFLNSDRHSNPRA